MYSQDYNYADLYRQTNKLITDLEKAINGEYSAIVCYERLAEMAPNEEERSQIIEIQNDEKKHLQLFLQLYQNLTGSQVQPKLVEECASNYQQGLEMAFKDEQETVDFYLSVSDETSDAYIKDMFRRIAMDEQNHAVWYLFLMTRRR